MSAERGPISRCRFRAREKLCAWWLPLVKTLRGTPSAPGGSRAEVSATRRMNPSAAGPLVPTTHGKDDDRALMPTARVLGFEHSERSRPTDCRSPDACLPFPQPDATRRAEARRRRRPASERHAVGCCGRVGRLSPLESPKLRVNPPLADNHETRCYGEV